jgi:indolepyruvate ferredoxin oxidoreductase
MIARAIADRIHRFHQSETIQARLDFLERKERSLAQPRKIAERVPHFCSGCPHNISTKVPEGSRAMGGIGCHYMATWMPDRDTFTFSQMGGEGVAWIGQAPFTETKHVFQNLGDGTYFHSGILAIRAAQSANVNITYKILYNDAVAMTGGQPIDGELSVDDLVHQLRGEGIKRIALVTDETGTWQGKFAKIPGYSLHDRDDMDAVQRELREFRGVSVIVYVQTCAAEKRRRRKKGILEDIPKRAFINDAVCEGCGDCSKVSNCLSVIPKDTQLGRKRQIDQSACNKDFSCVKGFCPSFVTVHGGELVKKQGAVSDVVFDPLPEPQLPALDKPWNAVVTGIGGTGVLTVTAMVAMAAHIEGKGCATMNQTGLAQKFGAVVSHVRVASHQDDIKAVRIPAGEADLLVGCDLAVAASYESMGKVNIDRTTAVVNTAEVPTAAFVLDPDAKFHTGAMQQTIREDVGEDSSHFVNATAIATEILGDSIASNLFLLGYAYQKGLVPVSYQALERAIELNGVAVDFNKQAFLWGRRAAHQLEKVMAMVEPALTRPPELNLEELITDRSERLTAYQNAGYAQRYNEILAQLREADTSAGKELTLAVAKSLYKLMAYKDEYEVARLYTDGEFLSKLKAQFSGNYKLRFHLAPPLLSKKNPRTGQLIKREFPAWTINLFSLLAKFKFLRGTFLDVFGYTAERREERQDIEEYRELLEQLAHGVKEDNYQVAVQLAELPLQLRGFGHVKDQNREKLTLQREQLLEKFRGDNIVKFVERAA